MDWKHILVLLENTRNCTNRLDLALELARELGARVVGLHVVVHRYYEPDGDSLSQGAELQALFEERMAKAGVEGQWREVESATVGVSAAQVVASEARYADLVVLGQAEPSAGEQHLPEQVVLGAGRPVLIVPYAGNFSTIGRKVLVAWKDGRESARAVSDALPLLTRCSEVGVIEAAGEALQDEHIERALRYLEGHGIRAAAQSVSASQVGVADAILNRIPVLGTDLLVMGAFGHNGSGKPVLGEVAREMLQHMTVPVLMSH